MKGFILNNKQGFTLIELVIVIVILGILAASAAPKFIDLTDEAEQSVFLGIAAAFKSGVNQVHIAWLVRGNGEAIQDFIPVTGGSLSVNSNGYPADTAGTSLTLNSVTDCTDVWQAVLDSQDAIVSVGVSEDFKAEYNNNFTCTYIYNKNTSLTVDYDSISGEVAINS